MQIIPSQSDSFAPTLANVAGQLAPRSRKTYANDAAHLKAWLDTAGLSLDTLDRDSFIQYRAHLQETYAKVTAARMLVVARRLLDEAVKRGVLAVNPADGVRGFAGVGTNETPHRALDASEVRSLLAAIDRNTMTGTRDHALLYLMLKTGLRRSEIAALNLGDFGLEQGHHTIVVQHGKGDKRRITKCPVDAMRAVSDYLAATGRKDAGKDAPLFVRIRKAGQVTNERLSTSGIEAIVINRAKAIDVDLTPHGCRATYITMSLEGGAKLQQVQYAAGHADPRQTEHYQRRKLNLDDHAGDYVRW